MRLSVLVLSLAAALSLSAPSSASASECGGPGCVIAVATGVGGGIAAGVLLIPMAVESVYLARGERPPVGYPIASFVLVSSLVLPSVLLNLAGDRTGDAGFLLAASGLMAVGAAGVVMGTISLAKEEGPLAQAEQSQPRWTLTPMLGEVRRAAVTLVGF